MNYYSKFPLRVPLVSKDPLKIISKKNRLNCSLVSDSLDCKEKGLTEIEKIFDKFFATKTLKIKSKIKKIKKNRNDKNPSPSAKPESLLVYKPLNLRCYTPTFTIKKSTPKKSHKRIYSLFGTRIEKSIKRYPIKEKQDASTFM